MSIEAITYGLVAAYRPELSLAILRKWQPSKLMNELKNIDPYVESAPIVSIQNPKTGKWEKLFEKEHRLSSKWLNKAHNSISSFLHVQIEPNEKNNESATEIIKNKIIEYSFEMQKALSSNSWSVIIRNESIEFNCDCGNKIIRRKELISEEIVIKCSECPKQYDVYSDDTGKTRIKLRNIIWECNFCQTQNAFPEHQLSERYLVRCRKCSEPAQIRKEWMIFQSAEKKKPKSTRAARSNPATA